MSATETVSSASDEIIRPATLQLSDPVASSAANDKRCSPENAAQQVANANDRSGQHCQCNVWHIRLPPSRNTGRVLLNRSCDACRFLRRYCCRGRPCCKCVSDANLRPSDSSTIIASCKQCPVGLKDAVGLPLPAGLEPPFCTCMSFSSGENCTEAVQQDPRRFAPDDRPRGRRCERLSLPVSDSENLSFDFSPDGTDVVVKSTGTTQTTSVQESNACEQVQSTYEASLQSPASLFLHQHLDFFTADELAFLARCRLLAQQTVENQPRYKKAQQQEQNTFHSVECTQIFRRRRQRRTSTKTSTSDILSSSDVAATQETLPAVPSAAESSKHTYQPTPPVQKGRPKVYKRKLETMQVKDVAIQSQGRVHRAKKLLWSTESADMLSSMEKPPTSYVWEEFSPTPDQMLPSPSSSVPQEDIFPDLGLPLFPCEDAFTQPALADSDVGTTW